MSTANMTLPEPLLLDRAGLKSLGIGFSDAWLLRMEAAGNFPRRVSLGGRRCHWVRSEVVAFIERRMADRQGAFEERRRVARPGLMMQHGPAA